MQGVLTAPRNGFCAARGIQAESNEECSCWSTMLSVNVRFRYKMRSYTFEPVAMQGLTGRGVLLPSSCAAPLLVLTFEAATPRCCSLHADQETDRRNHRRSARRLSCCPAMCGAV